MKIIKNNFRFFKEPYAAKDRYWLIDVIEGDIYQLSQDAFDALSALEDGSIENTDSPLFHELEQFNLFTDDNKHKV